MVFKILSDITERLTASNNPTKFHLGYIPSKDGQNNAYGTYITLLNINENTSNKVPYSYKKNNDNKFQTQNPSMHLDLYIMISAYNDYYDESLKSIDQIIQTFANNFHFKMSDEDIEYSLQLVNLSMEQNNNLWQALSNNILPHVIYKIRSIIIHPEAPNAGILNKVSEIEIKTVVR